MTDNVDVALIQDENGDYDIEVDATTGDFVGVTGFQTALVISIFAERRADASEVSQPEKRRGWLGNLSGPFAAEGFEIGSKVWLLDQSRNTQGQLNKAIGYVKDALQWFIDEGIVQGIRVSGDMTGKGITLNADLFTAENRTESVLIDLLKETIRAPDPTDA